MLLEDLGTHLDGLEMSGPSLRYEEIELQEALAWVRLAGAHGQRFMWVQPVVAEAVIGVPYSIGEWVADGAPALSAGRWRRWEESG